MSPTFTESIVEGAGLAWLEAFGWTVKHGPDIAPETPVAERTDYGQITLTQRLPDALGRLDPRLPAKALDDAFRELTRPEGPTPDARNRAVHRWLVDGVTVGYRFAAPRDTLAPKLADDLRIKDVERIAAGVS